jgi:DNA-binding HxlR family transcriptional regulator
MKPGYQKDTIAVPSASAAKKRVKDFLDTVPSARVAPSAFCPIKDVLHAVSDKWSMLVMMQVGTRETVRFTELKGAIPGISQKMLTSTLRQLEGFGLVSRKVYAEIPPRVEYSITPIGTSFLQHFVVMLNWACTSLRDLKRQQRKALGHKGTNARSITKDN